MNWLIRKYHKVKAAITSCFGLNRMCAPAATVAGHKMEAMGTTKAKTETPSDSESNEIAHNEDTNREAQPPDVAPQNTIRPPIKVDYAFPGPGETSPPEEPVTAFISPSSNRASLLFEPEPIGDRREDSHPASTPTIIRRKALLIGILYTDECDPDWNEVELSTPWDDVTKMKRFLEDNGYEEDCIKILSDSPEAKRQGLGLPERDGIVDGINWLVNDARPGDYLFLHYCGHGYQIPADNYLELDGMDEVIVPLNANKNYLTDNELYNRLVVPLPVGCKLMTVWDCCHAGTMLDLAFEYERTETHGGAQRKTPGGPSNRYKRQIVPRKTTHPLTMENRIKILRTVKRSPASETHKSYELEVSHPSPMAALESRVPTVHVPGRQVDMSVSHPTRPSSSYEQRPMPSHTSAIVMEQTRSSTRSSGRTEEVGSPQKNQVWTDATSRPSSPISMEAPTSLTELHSTQTSTIPKESLNFFTTRTIDGIRKHESFGLPNHQPNALAQVISIAACHDDQSVFEILPGDATPTNKTKTTGGLLTTTFIEFMERKSPQKTLDDMLHYLSEAFIRETKRMHSFCCRCGKGCGKEECRVPTDKASARKGQCVLKRCLIPTIPPNPLVSTLTDKRRQTLITV